MNCTIVSYYKSDILEKKNGLYPGEFFIPAAKGDEPSLLVVGESCHYVEGKEDMPPTKVVTQPDKMADSIIKDYIFDKALAIEPGERQPAIFWVEGEYSPAELKAKFAEKIKSVKQMQKEWYLELVRLADDTWAKNPNRHKLIAEDARVAAREMNLDRPWVMEAEDIKINCKFCKVPVDQDAIICYSCKNVLKPEEYKQLTGTK